MSLDTDLLGCGMAPEEVLYQRLDKQHVKPISTLACRGGCVPVGRSLPSLMSVTGHPAFKAFVRSFLCMLR